MRRGCSACCICPKVGELMSPFGNRKLAWLKILKNSALNYRLVALVTRMSFREEKSHCANPGPWTTAGNGSASRSTGRSALSNMSRRQSKARVLPKADQMPPGSRARAVPGFLSPFPHVQYRPTYA